MQRPFLLLLLLFAGLVTRAQTSSQPTGDAAHELQPTESTHDFGQIPQGKPITYTFVLVNHTGDTLRLAHVEASCGCTTPRWSAAPVPPGDSTSLPVTYNASGDGSFTKYISLFYTNNLHQQVYIKGDVWKTPDTSVPLNTGIQLVKQ